MQGYSDDPGLGLWHGRLLRFESLSSTNSWALANLPALRDGDVVSANSQTAGRGRFERTWVSLPGKCLTVSLILKDPAWIPIGPNLGQIAAFAVAGVLSGYGIGAQLKWPNDVMVDDRKISGILVERGGVGEGFVLGIGLNVNITPDEFRRADVGRPATSLLEASGRIVPVEEVMQTLLQKLRSRLDEVREHGMGWLCDTWSQRDWLKGQSVRLLGVDGEVSVGECLGISPEGGLRLRTLEGYERVHWSGDVERVIKT